MYTEDELLPLSGIQHYVFCPRQWYLIHVECLWEENHLTMQGHHLHERVHQPEQSQRRGNVVTLRSVPLASSQLGLYGYSDAVELHPASESTGACFTHPKYPGRWNPLPIEYKRGHSKWYDADRIQLCAESICLEEAYQLVIPRGYLYYGEEKHREEVSFTSELRDRTQAVAEEMHRLYQEKHSIPPKLKSKACRSCSLLHQCLPELAALTTVKSYLRRLLV